MKRKDYRNQRLKDGGLVLSGYLSVGMIFLIAIMLYLLLNAAFSYFVRSDELYETMKTITAWTIFGIALVVSAYVTLRIAAERFDESDDEEQEEL